jgi:hypothetical protein
MSTKGIHKFGFIFVAVHGDVGWENSTLRFLNKKRTCAILQWSNDFFYLYFVSLQ